MSYEILADLIEKHKRELAEKATKQAIILNVIVSTQIEIDTQGFEASFEEIALYVRRNNIKEWYAFVERITKGQVERGVPDEGGLGIADYMIECINEMIVRELAGEHNKTQREKFLQRLQAMHSMGRITIIVTQIKTRENMLPLTNPTTLKK